MVVKEDKTRRLQDPLSDSDADEFAPNKDIQFGYHRATGKRIRITSDGLRAEKMNSNSEDDSDVAYGACPLKGDAEFEVKIVSYGGGYISSSLAFGVLRYKRSVPIKRSHTFPRNSERGANHFVWSVCSLHNNLITPREESDYGYANLDDLCEGDCVGLRLSHDGVLEFFVNGESQGIAAKNIYTRDTDVYAVVDHWGRCVATVITKAGECSHLADVHVKITHKHGILYRVTL